MTYQTTIERPVRSRESACTRLCTVALRLVPAPADTGIVFRRVDLDNFEIEAHVRNVARVSYATSLMKKGVLLSTTEHLLAALYSCGMDNVYVEIDALELPILDGSSQALHRDARRRPACASLRRRRRYSGFLKPLEFADGDRRIGIYPAENFASTASWIIDHPAVGPQEVEMAVDRESFSRELAPARTFSFREGFLRALRRWA